MSYNKKSIKQEWVTTGISLPAVEWAESFGKFLANAKGFEGYANKKKCFAGKMTTTQIRKFLGEVKRLQAKGYNEAELTMLLPMLAYADGRDKIKNGTQNKTRINDFVQEMSIAIKLVLEAKEEEESKKRFKNFTKILEAIVAYHRAGGGQ